jgi:TonB family protein
MAPILKEADASVSTAIGTPAAPHAKPANESATRPQPVALEIPVTVNGARTIDGSEKRVPFSESTQTVLVFSHGAVVRIATPLAAGQLVFLTNEKTKKEVVCQVVKCKSTGNAAAYVELQFTEASAGFWGLSAPGGATAPASRPGPIAVAPKIPAPSSASSVKPPVAAKPSTPAVISAPVAKPTIPSVSAAPNTQPVSPTVLVPQAPAVVAAPPIAAAPPVAPEPTHIAPSAPADSAPHVAATPHQPSAPPPAAVPPATHPASPLSPLHDYSKQIDALFTKPQSATPPSIPDLHQTPPAPSTNELKQQAARLQEQLSSLLFTETHPASPTSSNPQAPVTEEEKPALTERKPPSAIQAADEEVKIPSWLAPLSQDAEATVASDTAEKSETSPSSSALTTSEESHEALEAAASGRTQSTVIGGQLLGQSAATGETVSSGSKKGLLIGIAATVLIAAGAWYFYQNHSASTSVATTSVTSPAPATTAAPTNNSAPASSASASHNVISSAAPATPPVARKTTPAPEAEVQPKENRPASKAPEAVQEAAKPALGDVHLAAPVVSHNSNSQADSAALPSIDTNSVSAGGDPLATAEARHNAPVAPLPVGGDVQQARLIKSVPPQYPSIAKAQRISGKVQVDALIDKSGNVANAKVISGPPLLYGAAIDAVKQWKYSPALLDGEPTSIHLTVTVEFRAQ